MLPSPLTPLAATPGWTRELVSKFRRRWEGRFLFYQDIYTNREQVLLCEDYKEMVEIALKLLRSELPGSLPGRRLVLFTRPSSWHGIPTALFSEKVDKDIKAKHRC